MEEIAKDVRHFIFEYIDSVEQLEVLLFLRRHKDNRFTSAVLSQEFRSSVSSIEARLQILSTFGLIEKIPGEPVHYRYPEVAEAIDQTIGHVDEEYRRRRSVILEMLFSPLKKGRLFSNAFVVFPVKKEEDGEDDGNAR